MTLMRLLAAALALGILAEPATAQTSGCTVTPYTDPPRQVLRCADGLEISTEAGAASRVVDGNRDGRPDAMELTGRAVLVDKPPRRRGGFQILTPHAIASVRGTVWAVDVTATRTSVFVQAGTVAVTRPGLSGTATLRAGDGIDVEPGSAALEVRRWSPQRAAALLARFGR